MFRAGQRIRLLRDSVYIPTYKAGMLGTIDSIRDDGDYVLKMDAFGGETSVCSRDKAAGFSRSWTGSPARLPLRSRKACAHGTRTLKNIHAGPKVRLRARR